MEQVLRPQGQQHPLLGGALKLSEESGRKFFENQNFSIAGACWMADHKIQGQVICPGMAFVEVFLECARQCKARQCPRGQFFAVSCPYVHCKVWVQI